MSNPNQAPESDEIEKSLENIQEPDSLAEATTADLDEDDLDEDDLAGNATEDKASK